jgi:hypothetical protein
MTITTYPDLEQGSDLWFELRCGLLTAGSTGKLVTPATLKRANNDKVRAHMWELLAERITNYTPPTFLGDKMIRGLNDEITARDLYSERYEPVTQMGLVINDAFGFKMGFSPDGLVGDDGLIEVKSRDQRFQAETIVADEVPEEYQAQIQAGLLITERKWCDFISYSGGMPMFVKRVFPRSDWQTAILDAATAFEAAIAGHLKTYRDNVAGNKFIDTERAPLGDMEITV